MEKAHIAAKFPVEVELKAGKIYAWCSCGLSKNQPHCDGSHSKGNLKPKMYTSQKTEKAWFCQCKQTSGSPFCDGSHKRL
ncbi:MAG: CDGSH iron-sulfur domain-containing protein [Cyclobacteriaceae bacterium]|nr:CDGSH iron-sulfur domain-containing protein [Cyclobacteriaceae bacterium]